MPVRETGTDASTKPPLLMQLEREYRCFVSTVASVDERQFRERWLDGRWGVAEIVALHADWLRKLAEGLQLARSGIALERIDWLRLDDWDEAYYGLPREKDKPWLLADLERAFNAFTSAAQSLPEATFGEPGLVARIFSYTGMCKFRLHASLIEAWRQGRLGEAGTTAA